MTKILKCEATKWEGREPWQEWCMCWCAKGWSHDCAVYPYCKVWDLSLQIAAV